jgi:nitrate/nitrite transporter NarK
MKALNSYSSNKSILWIFASSRILSVTAFLISAIVWTEFKRLLVNIPNQQIALSKEPLLIYI